MRKFFLDAAFATWVQNLVIIISVLVAYMTLKDSDVNLRITNSTAFAQRYVLDKPSLSVSAAELIIAQYNTVQDAKKTITGYSQDAAKASAWDKLFEVARPMVLTKISSDSTLSGEYSDVASFFRSLIACVDAQVCDKDTAVKLLAGEMLAFYNAVCPYIEVQEQKFNNKDESAQFLVFLTSAGYTDQNAYFCRSQLNTILHK